MESLLWTVYTSILRDFWTPHVQNYTEINMTNHVINYQEAFFYKIKYSFGVSLK